VNVSPIYDQRCLLDSDIVGHMPRLYAEAAIGNAQIIELGVRTGNSTSAFLAAVEQHGGHVWSVDIVQPDVPWHDHPQWTLTIADDRDVVDVLPDDVDVLFIDTSHFYGHTLSELRHYVPKVRTGGVVLMHDTELTRTRPGDPIYPVRAAIERFCKRHLKHRRFTLDYVTGSCGLGVIRL
jgi:predicted O-methyltransferase YrrM